ncbi:MAG: flagellar FliJ family protein [Clostridiales bacterium]|nr:flagellar FliJ family protein [Clostridiales bacterium]
MKKFKYSLENILKLRNDNEDKKLTEMSVSLNQYLKDVESEEVMAHTIEETIDKMHSTNASNVRDQKSYYLYLEKLRYELEEQKKIVDQAKMAYEAKKEEYIKAQMDRKLIEKHKEKKIEASELEVKRAEEQLLGEMAIASFNRKKFQ